MDNGAAQNMSHGLPHPGQFLLIQRSGREGRMDFGLEQYFISVDISDSSEEGLVQEKAFHTCFTAFKKLHKMLFPDLQWFRTKLIQDFNNGVLSYADAGDKAKFSDIPKTQFKGTFCKSEAKVSVFVPGFSGEAEKKLPRHLQMKDEGQSPVHLHQNVFSPAIHLTHLLSQDRIKISHVCFFQDRRIDNPERQNRQSGKLGVQMASNHFDFG